jgi:sugar O-acyltransferase (sialic acid O-acetyltransferase NeuD family)
VKKLIIYGAGGLGREVKSMLSQCVESYQLIGFLDDGVISGKAVEGIPVLGGVSWLATCPADTFLILAIGNPKTKRAVLDQIKPEWNISFANLQHQRAVVQSQDHITIGVGSILGAGCVLTTGISIGRHVLINLNATLGHDSSVGDCTSIMPNVSIAGQVMIGHSVMIGSGANIINQVSIGDGALIGAGSVVNHDIAAGTTAAGVPARSIK